MNFNEVNKITQKYFEKPYYLGNKYLQPYSEYIKDIKYPLVFIISFYFKNEFCAVIANKSNDKSVLIFSDNYKNYSKQKFENIIKALKVTFKNLEKINRNT